MNFTDTISAPCTTANAEKSNGVAETHNNKPKGTRGDSATGLLGANQKRGACDKETHGAEKPYQAKRRAKTERFVAKMKALRSDPRNCKRCGKPRDCEMKQCRSCVEKAAKRRLLTTYMTLHKKPDLLNAIMKRIESLENTVARHSLVIRRVRKEAWGKGYNRGRKAEFFLWQQRQVELPIITPQELATINHAYDRGES